MSAVKAIDGGMAVTYLSATHTGDTATRNAAARRVLSAAALDRHPGARTGDPTALQAAARWRADMYAALGLDQPHPAPEPAPEPAPAAPSSPPPVTHRRADDGDRWRTRAACRDVDPELFHPLSELDLPRIDAAKAVCGRCPVADRCLTWAVDTGQAHGVWGGLTAEQRRRATDTTETPEVTT